VPDAYSEQRQWPLRQAIDRPAGALAAATTERLPQYFLADLRSLWRECIEGVRRSDPPEAWYQRLERIAELRERLQH
jgi:hypothetical protein